MGKDITGKTNSFRLIIGVQLDLLHAIHQEDKAESKRRYQAARRKLLEEFLVELQRLVGMEEDVNED